MSSKEIRLKDYAVPAFRIQTVDLDIDIQKDHARVVSRIKLERNKKAKDQKASLFLNGEAQKLIHVILNGKTLSKKDYKLTAHGLTIPNMPNKAVLEIASTHDPYNNTALAGLYASGPMLSTQCEAEGFRRITFYPDRPDVMAKFRVTIHADKKKYPVLLANGNLVAIGDEGGSRHFAIWEDPFPKPCYLFAMVAGKMDLCIDHFTTKSGRNIQIEIYVEPGKTKETAFALDAIKKSMKWDEERFGLEYDLDRFMMVATPFFNMGAMENKGLNIFNDACVLGRTETATDATISFIERVVAHEYFHNWTGDRITCRDWFQLSLKEGLTVFREQEYMGDAHSIAVERLENVRDLRRRQFAEDASALAHPVRPDHYQAIDNFYTVTVYDKGAEVIRMIQTLVGREGFNKGMALYVKRHDGQAATCDDFVKAMADANKIDLKQFMRWYEQAGTPVLNITSRYDEKNKKLTLKVTQSCPPTPGQPTKKPFHIPFAVGLLDSTGKDMIDTKVLSLTKKTETFTFDAVKEKPVLSLLRDCSAPVRVIYERPDDELLFLLAHDTDPFNRWEAGFAVATKLLLDPTKKDAAFINALKTVMDEKTLDPDLKTMILTLPQESDLGLEVKNRGNLIDIDTLYAARKRLVKKIGISLKDAFAAEYAHLVKNVDETKADGTTMGLRGLKNLCLAYLAETGDPKIIKEVYKQATRSKNMTDRITALSILVDKDAVLAKKALAVFEKKWGKVPTIMDKWFALQASAKRKNVLGNVKKLLKHPAFTIKNPNRVSALIGVFAANGLAFHAKDGSGYRFMEDIIRQLDPLNPQKAASLTKAFTRWRDYTPDRQKLMKKTLRQLSKKKLSPNTAEVVQKSLKD